MAKTATPKQAQAIQNLVENRGKSIGRAMIEAGYDETTAKNPKNLTESVTFQALVKRIPYKEIIDNVVRIALDRNDKRSALGGAHLTFRIGDKYPAERAKIVALFDRLSDLEE